eukprot:COSAG04_NODE_11475_length_707_cov_0.950658_1_plen_124_part_00
METVYFGTGGGYRPATTAPASAPLIMMDMENGLYACSSKDCTNNSPQGLTLKNVAHADISGVTFVDFPNHHIIAAASERPDGWSKPCAASSASRMTNIKVMGWRANGDVRVPRAPAAELVRWL